MESSDVFTINKFIGQGAFGQVAVATIKREIFGLEVGRVVAVKIVNKSLMESKDKEMFDREIEILKSITLACPDHVSQYFGSVDLEGGRSAVIMEYIRGQTIEDVVSEAMTEIEDPDNPGETMISYDIRKLISDSQIVSVMNQLLKGLKCLHDNSVVHRDIKEANMIYDQDAGRVKYIDFGFACRDVITGGPFRCNTGGLGSWQYISPERWEWIKLGARELESQDDVEKLKAADVWALGIVFYNLLFGGVPWQSADSENIELFSEEVMEPSEILFFDYPGDQDLIELIKMMLKKNWTDRWTANKCVEFIQEKFEEN